MVNLRPFDQLMQPPIFVVGVARSGTTWVEDIMTAHPEVAGIHESWLFTEKNGLGALFGFTCWSPKNTGLGRILKREELIACVRDFAIRIMEHAILPGHRFLVEKSPSHLYTMSLINKIFTGARFIHVLRDGRDVCVSIRAASRSWEPEWRKTFGRSIVSSARSWKDAVNRVRKYSAKLSEHFLEIRYESIHADPFHAYRQLFDFCSIPYNDDILQTVFDKTNFARNYKPNEAGFRRGGRVGDWCTHFSLIDAMVFNIVAGGTLVKLGYERNRIWLPNLFERFRPLRNKKSEGLTYDSISQNSVE